MQILNLFFPPQCPSCKVRVVDHGALCPACFASLKQIIPPWCACCGLPFEVNLGEGALCADCIQEAPVFTRARSAVHYAEAGRHLAIQLKYQDEGMIAKIVAPWMQRAGVELIANSDVIAPVPLHIRRYLSRRYNQSLLLARAIAKQNTLPLIPDLLKRTRATLSQTGLKAKERQENVKGAFAVNEKYDVAGKRVLLIDDVMTTGATLNACAKPLLEAGAQEINVLTLARNV